MILYGVPLSPFYERCYLVAEMKGQADAITLGGVPGHALHSPEHMAHNPFGKIPYLKLSDGRILAEGQVVAEYLDAVLAGPDMLSGDAAERAEQQMLCRMVDMYLIEPLLTINRGAVDDAKEAAKEAAKAMLAKFEHFFAPGKFAVGDSLSVTDCALIPYIFHYARAVGDTDFSASPALARWWDNVRDSDPVKNSHARIQASLEQVMAMRAAAAKAAAKAP